MALDRLESEVNRLRDERGDKAGKIVREEASLPRDVYALLAQANLLRMRGLWDEAAQKCMDALRLAPDSSSANSLLGDIYENQGRYEDASQWYRMALDVNPGSIADRLKLDRLNKSEETRRNSGGPEVSGQPAVICVGPSQMQPSVSSPPNRIQQAIRDPESLLRYGAIVAALALILVVACAYRVVHHSGSLNSFGIGEEAVVKSPPVIVPPLAGALSSDPDAAAPRDPSEQSLLTLLQASHDLSALGLSVYDVQIDPRAGRTTITFGMASTSDHSQGQISRDALIVLQAAAATASSQEQFTVRCLLVSDADKSAATLAFVGDVSRNSLPTFTSAGSGLTDTQAAGAFSNVWWSLTADIRA